MSTQFIINDVTKKFHLIPWDLDNAFENIILDSNPVTLIKVEWGKTSANCEPFNYEPFFVNQRSAASDKLTAGQASFENEFNLLKTEFINGPLSFERANAKLNDWKTQFYQTTFNVSENHSDVITIPNWENFNKILKQELLNDKKNYFFCS